LFHLWTGNFAPVDLSARNSAVVLPERTEFIFAPAPRQTWEWSLPGAGEAEYAWGGRVVRDGGGHELGAYLFTRRDRSPRRGSLAQLIAECQASVWAVTKEGGKLITDCQVSVDERERVHIVVTEPTLIQKIFAQQPAKVSFVIKTRHEAAVQE